MLRLVTKLCQGKQQLVCLLLVQLLDLASWSWKIHASSFMSCLPGGDENSSIAWSIVVFASTKCGNGGV